MNLFVRAALLTAFLVSVSGHVSAQALSADVSDGSIPNFHACKPNAFCFPPTQARFVRLTISGGGTAEPCIDEIEVYGPDKVANLALASAGAKASASSSLKGYAIHCIEHVNDGLYGNDHSWICDDIHGWVQLEWPRSITVSEVVLSRDRTGVQQDRLLTTLGVQLSLDGQQWTSMKLLKGKGSPSTEIAERLSLVNPGGLLLALDDLVTTAPERYPDAAELRKQVQSIPAFKPLLDRLQKNDAAACAEASGIIELQRRILLSNPLLDFDQVLAVKRGVKNLGLPINFHSNSSLSKTGYDNQVIRFSLHGKTPDTVVFTPEKTRFVGDLCLHYQADKYLFSMPNDKDWQVFEVNVDGTGLRQVSPDIEEGVGNYDACYLPNGEYLFTSTLPMVSVPCDAGNAHVANLVRLSVDGRVRQLCFDQEHNWCPRVLANGTVLYQRWEYADTPHSNTRLLMTMNPDGTNQRNFYGSNSYWPTAFFYATPIPGSATTVAGISTGHHGDCRFGELYILDVTKGRNEDSGVVAQIPSNPTTPSGKGKIYDHMDNVWPRFLHPQPLSDKYILVACQPTPQQDWGVYLVDTFDNLLLLKTMDDYALLEPIPVIKRPVPPVLPDKVDLSRKDAVVQIQDIYEGPGLKGLPRGTVKFLRVSSYTFSYHGVGGLYGVIGQDGPWDIKRPIGLVPVYEDGSAKFRVPANTPISIQPLDANGQALALMRSWMTAMPGEVLSCVGCHEDQTSVPPVRNSVGNSAPVSEIELWRPKVAGFSFAREVQPVLDRHCVGCHDGVKGKPDLRGGTLVKDWRIAFGFPAAGKFSTSYCNLFPYVRNNGIEGDYHLLSPMEFHFSSTELGQLLRKGHHGVKLDHDAFDRLVTWHDMNRPYHGSWSSIHWQDAKKLERQRAELRDKYAGVCENHEDFPPEDSAAIKPVLPEPCRPQANPSITLSGWPFDAARAKVLQGDMPETVLAVDGLRIALVRIPAGEFVMGSATGHTDEQPLHRVAIARPFLMGTFEITNDQYRKFDPSHDSRVADALNYQFGQRPWSLNGSNQPVCRVSLRNAMAFCTWLSSKTGRNVTLPTEAQWEWAARAGTATDYPFGALGSDYAKYANFADISMKKFAATTYHQGYHGICEISNPSKYDDYLPKDTVHNDGSQLSAPPGSYTPNAFGLFDMQGNVSEWTRSLYKPYPYADDARNEDATAGERVVRGGSWWNRPFQCTSSYRAPYQDYQPVMWVGFRIVIEE
jgi:formylglycine-generating enzyme required for sulfatase activity